MIDWIDIVTKKGEKSAIVSIDGEKHYFSVSQNIKGSKEFDWIDRTDRRYTFKGTQSEFKKNLKKVNESIKSLGDTVVDTSVSRGSGSTKTSNT